MEFVIPFVTLTAMEIVLGIDNIVFIAILVGRLPAEQQAKARSLGLIGAMVTRILLLLSITWVMGLTKPVFHLTDLGVPEAWVQHEGALEKARAGHGDINGVSWKDLILLGGGFFLIWHSVREIHEKVEGHSSAGVSAPARASFGSVLVQIALFDIIFSLDSVITAVGMAQHIEVMVASVVVAMIVMLIFSGKISRWTRSGVRTPLQFPQSQFLSRLLRGPHRTAHRSETFQHLAQLIPLSCDRLGITATQLSEPESMNRSPANLWVLRNEVSTIRQIQQL